jgi:hypothetical protein
MNRFRQGEEWLATIGCPIREEEVLETIIKDGVVISDDWGRAVHSRMLPFVKN